MLGRKRGPEARKPRSAAGAARGVGRSGPTRRQLQPDAQQPGPGKVEPQSAALRHGLKGKVLEEAALLRPAPHHAPRDLSAGVSGQAQGQLIVPKGSS